MRIKTIDTTVVTDDMIKAMYDVYRETLLEIIPEDKRGSEDTEQIIVDCFEAAGRRVIIEYAKAALEAAPAVVGDAIGIICFGGIEGDELGDIDIQLDMKVCEKHQEEIVKTCDSVYLPMFLHKQPRIPPEAIAEIAAIKPAVGSVSLVSLRDVLAILEKYNK